LAFNFYRQAMTTSKSIIPSLTSQAALLLTAMLVGCGGGGGGGSAPAPPPPAPAPPPAVLVVPLAGNLLPTVPPPSYAADSFERPAFEQLNAWRIAAGAGPLEQAPQIDTAAAGHWNWIPLNTPSHTQAAGSPGFTGALVEDRVRAAGFTASRASEGIFGFPTPSNARFCAGGITAPYHLADAFYSWTRVGSKSGDWSTVRGGVYERLPGSYACVTVYAMTDTPRIGQVPASGAIVTFPFDGGESFARSDIDSEIPRPPRSVLPNNASGTPVLVGVRNADYVNWKADGTLNVTITQLEMKDDLGNIVPTGILSNADLKAGPGVVLNADPMLKDGQAVMTPLNPLVVGKVYRVNFSATLKPGAPALTKSWTFKAIDFVPNQ
jgi:hypothetical protein